MAKRNNTKAAQILVGAAFYGDQHAADKYSVSKRTIRNYRNAIADDAELSELFRTLKDEMADKWADDAGDAMRACINFINRAAKEGDPKDPQMVHSVAGAFKIMTEAELTKKVLDARLSK